jgi:deazaflavin-dependent oxidoreductase (nitroreductase family)
LASDEILAALKRATEIELSVKGRVSGKDIPRPVWFVLQKDRKSIALVPVNGKKTQWYLNVMKNPNVTVRIGGHSFTGRVKEVGEERLPEVLDMFTAKYGKGDMERYYAQKDTAMEVPLPS